MDTCSSLWNSFKCFAVSHGGKVRPEDIFKFVNLMQPEIMTNKCQPIFVGSHIKNSFLVLSLNIEVVSPSEEWFLDPPVLVNTINRHCALLAVDGNTLEDSKLIDAPLVEPRFAGVASLDNLDGVIIDHADVADGLLAFSEDHTVFVLIGEEGVLSSLLPANVVKVML